MARGGRLARRFTAAGLDLGLVQLRYTLEDHPCPHQCMRHKDIMENQTLGSRLQARIDAETADPRLKLAREARESGPEAQKALDTLAAFFEAAQNAFTQAIEQDRAVPQIKLARDENSDVYELLNVGSWRTSHTVFDDRHKYFAFAKVFLKWCSDNDLCHKLVWQHNDEDSWFLLSVEPATAPSVRGRHCTYA